MWCGTYSQNARTSEPEGRRTGLAKSWDSRLYDAKISFVPELGRGLVDLLDPRPGERVLDLACGTGDLTQQIVLRGAECVGLDSSAEMIRAARDKHPHLRFEVGDARTYRCGAVFDAVFSNAVLHWVREAEAAATTVWQALRAGDAWWPSSVASTT
ncbi:MAG: methyltransferase domain-containing protein [Bacillota bacterium]|nr:methyltransferase domain-containing protein [Bacillota bacterium]